MSRPASFLQLPALPNGGSERHHSEDQDRIASNRKDSSRPLKNQSELKRQCDLHSFYSIDFDILISAGETKTGSVKNAQTYGMVNCLVLRTETMILY